MLKRVAFQGEHGSFAEEAAAEFFSGDCQIIACPELSQLQTVLETEAADYAVLPVENSLIGKVQITNGFLSVNPWREVGELFLPIRLNLIGCSDAELDGITSVESHPAALLQCQKFFFGAPASAKNCDGKHCGERPPRHRKRRPGPSRHCQHQSRRAVRRKNFTQRYPRPTRKLHQIFIAQEITEETNENDYHNERKCHGGRSQSNN